MLVISIARFCLCVDWVFLAKTLRFILLMLGSLLLCALMVSSLGLSACFINDKRAWVIYCSLSWQWYIFNASNLWNLADKIYFIMFSGRKWETTLQYGAHNKVFLVTSIHSMFLLYSLPQKVILRDTYVLYMLFNVSCNRLWKSLRDETRWKNKQKVTRARSLSLCCSQVSVKKR